MGFRLDSHLFLGGALLFGGNALQAIVGLAASIVLARLLGPEAMGRFALVFASVGFVLSVLSLRLGTFIVRTADAALDDRRRRLYYSAAMVETGIAGVISFLWLSAVGLIDVWAVVLIVSQCVLHWTNVNKGFYERTMPYRQLAIVETSVFVIGNGVAVVAVLAGAGEAALYLRELLLALLLFVGLYAAGGLTFMPLRVDVDGWMSLFREARPVWLEGMMEGAFQRLTALTAGVLGDERSTGLFFLAQNLAMRPHQLLSPIMTRMASNWFREVEDPAHQQRGRNVLLIATLLVLVLGAVLLAWLAEPAVVLVLGEKWRDAAPILMALTGAIVFLTPFEILRIYGFIIYRGRALILARVAQYGGFVALTGTALAFSVPPMTALGLGVSAAFVSAFFILWRLLGRRKPG